MNVSKYSASGNDFVIFHTFVEKERSELARRICHRNEGIGADGLIILLPNAEADFAWQFYNSDGSIAAMCGNGSRACAHYAYNNGLSGSAMTFLTGAGKIFAEVDGNIVKSALTPPKVLRKDIEAEGAHWWLIDTGVPHLVASTATIEHFDLAAARRLRQHFDANVNIVSMDRESLLVRTYERGVENETLACGTGMAAAFYMMLEEGRVNVCTTIIPKSRKILELSYANKTLFLKGEVRHTFNADYPIIAPGE